METDPLPRRVFRASVAPRTGHATWNDLRPERLDNERRPIRRMGVGDDHFEFDPGLRLQRLKQPRDLAGFVFGGNHDAEFHTRIPLSYASSAGLASQILTPQFPHGHGSRHRDVEGFLAADLWDLDGPRTSLEQAGRNAGGFGTEQKS